jgi:hypothetical protein
VRRKRNDRAGKKGAQQAFLLALPEGLEEVFFYIKKCPGRVSPGEGGKKIRN